MKRSMLILAMLSAVVITGCSDKEKEKAEEPIVEIEEEQEVEEGNVAEAADVLPSLLLSSIVSLCPAVCSSLPGCRGSSSAIFCCCTWISPLSVSLLPG